MIVDVELPTALHQLSKQLFINSWVTRYLVVPSRHGRERAL